MLKLSKDRASLQDFTKARLDEWLETNGLGGWAGASITGCNTRRYHGLLVASIHPPTDRMNLVSKLDETIVLDGNRHELSTNDFGNAINPTGYQYLVSFNKGFSPEWIFEVNGIRLKKTIAMVQGENTTLINYQVLKSPKRFTIEFLPFIAARGYHSLQHAYKNIYWDVDFQNGVFHNIPYEGAPGIYISIPGSQYVHDPKWFYRFNYAIEKYRGLDYEEDLFNHGTFCIDLAEGDTLGIILSTENPAGKNAVALFERETERKASLIQRTSNSFAQELKLAADQFIVKRDVIENSAVESLKTIIAGYHWFADWGRDTMISLPGLCLSTGRYEDAKKIIEAFSKNVSMGMLPNRFQDNNEPPEYNTVDGTLWYFIAIHKYVETTNDNAFILDKILPVLKDIIDWHFKGTRYNIHVDNDGLLFAGEKGQQLTWMDVRIGDWVVTPRMGKPVEIQALWYNALRIFARLLELNGQSRDANIVNVSAEKARKSFGERFWYTEGRYLYDVIDENNNPDATLRPNQLLAMSLPYPIFDDERSTDILQIIKSKLYTPVGLRSLSPDDKRYVGHYGGDPFKRDSCYHQGAVWSWLLGPYIEAWLKLKNETALKYSKEVIGAFAYHLNEACIGSVSEIFDGDVPHAPRGCVAQAWGVAEVLRVISEYQL